MVVRGVKAMGPGKRQEKEASGFESGGHGEATTRAELEVRRADRFGKNRVVGVHH